MFFITICFGLLRKDLVLFLLVVLTTLSGTNNLHGHGNDRTRRRRNGNHPARCTKKCLSCVLYYTSQCNFCSCRVHLDVLTLLVSYRSPHYQLLFSFVVFTFFIFSLLIICLQFLCADHISTLFTHLLPTIS